MVRETPRTVDDGRHGYGLPSVFPTSASAPLPCQARRSVDFFLNLFLFLSALGLCCCACASSSCGERGLLLVAVHGLLIAVASLVAEHGL